VIKDNKSKFGTLILVKRGLIIRPKYPGMKVQIGAEVYAFDALRGEPQPNFEASDGESDDYLVQDSEMEDENTEESDDIEEEDNNPIIEGEIEEGQSPLLHRENTQAQYVGLEHHYRH
jgi:hypothetical protein